MKGKGEMDSACGLPRLYGEFAQWWPVLSAPEDYAEEAEFYRRIVLSHSTPQARTLLELGCGGGNNASHLKVTFDCTLVDLSTDRLAVSRALNPECEHHQGDMRTVRLDRLFDAVFIHDAVAYLTTETDLKAAMETAYCHCRPGGVALFCPDWLRETFRPLTDHGGHDRGGRSVRYLEWFWDPDPADTTYLSDMVYLFRQSDGSVQCEYDRHVCGLFPRGTWLQLLAEVGFRPLAIPFEHSEVAPGSTDVFVGSKPCEHA
jgi:SAM-dependent methyltransferase